MPGNARFVPLTAPWLTVFGHSPRALPIATTSSPARRASESPNAAIPGTAERAGFSAGTRGTGRPKRGGARNRRACWEINPDDGDIDEDVRADNLGWRLGPVLENNAQFLRAVHDVRVGDDVSEFVGEES